MPDKEPKEFFSIAQHKSLEVYRRVFFASPDYIAFSSLKDGVFLDVNPGFEKLIGYSREQVVGKSSVDVGMWPEEFADQRERFVEQLRRDGFVHNYPGILKNARGDRIEVEASANVVEIEGDLILLAIIRDVTSRNRAQRAQRDGAERLQFILDAAQIGDWEIDLATRQVLHRSLRHDQCFGYPNGIAEWTLDHFMEHLHPDDRADVVRRYEEALSLSRDWHFEGRVIWPDQSLHWIAVHASRRGDRLSGIIFDISARKEAEQAQRLADRRKDEFLAMLAHELRNPLAPITGAAQLLKLVGSDDPRVRKGVEIIERQAGHMARLMDDLLDVSRVTRGLVTLERERVDLNAVLEDALEQARPLIEQRGHHLSVELSPEPVELLGDRARLVQVFANLLNNAARYTSEGGEVGLRLQANEHHACVTVRDNGIGMSPELLPRVFDLFVQGRRSSDRSEGGLGLGLALVKSLVESHHGQVEVKSAGPGHGSTFIVRLPLLVDAAGLPLIAGKRAGEGAPRGLDVMVVDDNADAGGVLAMVLEGQGHKVTVMQDPLQALALARTSDFDAFLLDIGLPEMDGNALARELRGHEGARDALLIGISGYGQDSDRQASLRSGFDHYLVKPVNFETLQALLAARASSRGDRRAANDQDASRRT
jgi:PAS domain S-box-containing protein